jgi:hypothetical protein
MLRVVGKLGAKPLQLQLPSTPSAVGQCTCVRDETHTHFIAEL